MAWRRRVFRREPAAALRFFAVTLTRLCRVTSFVLMRMQLLWFGVLAVLTAASGFRLAAQTAENVLVVVNSESEISRKIAEYYAGRREVPGKNLCRIKVAEREEIPWQVYRTEVEGAVAGCLKSGDLKEKILYIVTTKGVPLKIAGTGGRRGDAASVDSELTLLYQRLNGQSPPTNGPAPNPLFGRMDAKFQHPAFPLYLVTRLDGFSFDDVRGIIDRPLQARNQGFFVIDLSSAGNDEGNRWLREAAKSLPPGRVRLEESRAVVYDAEDVIAYAAWGSNDNQRQKEGRRRLGFRWLPGAIATEYVSTNARTFHKPPESWTISDGHDHESNFVGSAQSLTADYIADGATGASGHVYEPYLQFTPRPQYLLAAYFSGRTLAESFYVSIPALSWMNVVVGDPLCRLGPPLAQEVIPPKDQPPARSN
jgi:uncharacterized protein (TIGR03790 family)